jgi:hypothetical protein
LGLSLGGEVGGDVLGQDSRFNWLFYAFERTKIGFLRLF